MKLVTLERLMIGSTVVEAETDLDTDLFGMVDAEASALVARGVCRKASAPAKAEPEKASK